MQIEYGAYKIRTHELDQKLTVQVTSDRGEVQMEEDDRSDNAFPNGISYAIENPSAKPEPKGLKKYAFGEYTFILGIDFAGHLHLFHSVKLSVGKKIIDGKATLNLAFLKDPKA